MMAQFYSIALDVVQGEGIKLECTVDGDEGLKQEFVFVTEKRSEYKTVLPSWFKGRYMDVRVFGNATAARLALYGIIVESSRRGEFS